MEEHEVSERNTKEESVMQLGVWTFTVTGRGAEGLMSPLLAAVCNCKTK